MGQAAHAHSAQHLGRVPAGDGHCATRQRGVVSGHGTQKRGHGSWACQVGGAGGEIGSWACQVGGAVGLVVRSAVGHI